MPKHHIGRLGVDRAAGDHIVEHPHRGREHLGVRGVLARAELFKGYVRDVPQACHLLPVDPTLHWCNPAGPVDAHGMFTPGQTPRYDGPVPMVPHLHGAVGVGDESDGFPQAWFLPDAANVSAGYAHAGSWYQHFAATALARYGATWTPGSATYHYPNSQSATTRWYHDYVLGMTRINVYAGPAGF